jgi:CheY-like chemotaxis protein
MLPCAEAKTETVDLPEQALVVPKTSVLLVDDDPGVLNTFTELLRFLGYRVTPASGAAPALEALENGLALDILITDVIMPGLRGPDLAQRVWETRVGLPVIFISGFADPELVPLMNTKSRMLRKPCRAAELTAAITALVERTA